MDIRLLRFFVAVYEEQNITAAAERCHVSQPSISSAIKQLESELDTPLFTRHKKGVSLTDSAHHLYPLASRLVNQMQTLPGLFRDKKHKQPVRIGNFHDLSQTEIAAFLTRLARSCPDILIEFVDHDDEADIRLTLDILKSSDEIFLPLWEEDYVLCMLPGHPLATRESIKPAELHQYDFIECPPCEAHQQTISLLACEGLAVNLVARAEHKTQVMHLVQAGIGISFLPTGVLESAKNLVTVPLDGPRMFRRIGICYTGRSASTPTIANVIRAVSSDSAALPA